MVSFRKLESLQESLAEATNQSQRVQELLDRANEDHKTELSSLNTQHEKTISQLHSEKEEIVCFVVENSIMIDVLRSLKTLITIPHYHLACENAVTD